MQLLQNLIASIQNLQAQQNHNRFTEKALNSIVIHFTFVLHTIDALMGPTLST